MARGLPLSQTSFCPIGKCAWRIVGDGTFTHTSLRSYRGSARAIPETCHDAGSPSQQ